MEIMSATLAVTDTMCLLPKPNAWAATAQWADAQAAQMGILALLVQVHTIWTLRPDAAVVPVVAQVVPATQFARLVEVDISTSAVQPVVVHAHPIATPAPATRLAPPAHSLMRRKPMPVDLTLAMQLLELQLCSSSW